MMANFLKFLKSFGGESFLGVDIGTASIKAVELENENGKPKLKNYGMLESHGHLNRVNDAIQTSGLKLVDKQTTELLKRLLDEMNPKTKDTVASLPAYSAFTSLLEVPVMSEQETAQTMQYQAKTFVPMPLTDVTIDWIPVGEFEDSDGNRKQRVFLISIPNEQIEKYSKIFEEVGLNLRFLEIETMSLSRLLTTGDKTNSLIVDIGARSTAICVASGGVVKYNSQTDFAGSSLTQAVVKGLGISALRAEDLKRQKGVSGTGGAYQLSTLMLPYLDVILNEVRRVRDTYEKNYHDRIERIIVSGGGANLIGIEKYVSDQVGNLPTIRANPFDKVKYPPDFSPFSNTLGPPLAVALGLSMRQFS